MKTMEMAVSRAVRIQKLGSVALIIATVLIIVGNVWVATVDLSNPVVARERMSRQLVSLDVVTLMMTVGWYGVLMGAVAIHSSIKEAGAEWATMGLYLLVVGTSAWTVGMSLDISLSALISNWLSAPPAQQTAAYNLLNTLFPARLGFGRGLFPLEILVNWLAFGFLGLGMLRSCTFPRWITWPGPVLGIIGVGFGIIMTFTGREAVFTPFTVLAFLTLLWFLVTGIWMARKAW